MAVMPAGRGGRLRRGGGRSAQRVQRGTPLAAAVTAIALTVAVFPDALHSSVAGPGPQGAVQPHAQASVTHEGDVPPLSLGQSGAGADGAGAGTGRPSAVQFGGQAGGLGAGSNPGFGAGAGAGAGVGSGSARGPGGGTGSSSPTQTPPASGSQPTQTPPPPPASPPATACPSCQGGQGRPAIPFCYSNSLGPDSQTTEDPLSPPCVSWDGAPGASDPEHGIDAGHIDVALLDVDPSLDASINIPDDPTKVCNPASEFGCYDRNVRVFRQFFLSHFQTYGRTVNFHGFVAGKLRGQALADAIQQTLHPFAVLFQPSDCYCFSVAEVQAFARDEMEVFTLDDITLNISRIDQSIIEAGSPYIWSVNPSTDELIDEGASWVCDTLLRNPVSVSNDPALDDGTVARKVALGYRTGSATADRTSSLTPAETLERSRELAQRMAAVVGSRCPGSRVDAFCDAAGNNCQQAIHVESSDSPPDASVAATALATMQRDGDTTLVCVLCGNPGIGQDAGGFAQTEASLRSLNGCSSRVLLAVRRSTPRAMRAMSHRLCSGMPPG